MTKVAAFTNTTACTFVRKDMKILIYIFVHLQCLSYFTYFITTPVRVFFGLAHYCDPLRSMQQYPVYSLLYCSTSKKTINSIKKCKNRVHKTCVKTEIITSSNATKHPDEMCQLVTQHSCYVLETTPPSQVRTIKTITFRLTQVVGGIISIFR